MSSSVEEFCLLFKSELCANSEVAYVKYLEFVDNVLARAERGLVTTSAVRSGRLLGCQSEGVVVRVENESGVTRPFECSASVCYQQVGGVNKENDCGAVIFCSQCMGKKPFGVDVGGNDIVGTDASFRNGLCCHVSADGISPEVVGVDVSPGSVGVETPFVDSFCGDQDESVKGVESVGKGKCDGLLEETKTERNRRWRVERKTLKKKRQFMNQDWRSRTYSNDSNVESTSLVSEEDVALKSSLKAKWKVQNELAVEKARRELEVLKASDINQEVKRYRTKISAATERNMVSIEKTHAKLRKTGNLPEERGGGFAETVVSDVPGLESGSGTISPDSSASMAEFRACQKALLDAERENAEYKRKIKIASEKYGFPLEQVDFLDKEVWTDTQTNQDILDEIYPNGYGKDTSLFEDGKFRAIGV